MRKIAALYLNEIIKIIRKVSIFIILGVMVALVVGMGALIKFQTHVSQSSMVQSEELGIYKQQMTDQENDLKGQLTDVENKIKAASEADLPTLDDQKASLQSQIEMYDYAISHDIILSSPGYRAQALQQIYQYKPIVAGLKAVPPEALSADQKKQLSQYQSDITKLQNAIENEDFAAYISVANEIIDQTPDLTKDEKNLRKQTNDLKLKLNDTAENAIISANVVDQQISKIENDRRSLLYNLDYTQSSASYMKPLTSDRRTEIGNDITVTTYKLEHGIGTKDNGQNYADISIGTMEYIGTFVLVILMLILAGSSVSQEIATGSIKSLIIAPMKRWKILTSKLLSLITVLLVCGVILYGVSILTNGLFYGFGACSPYIYASGGAAHVIGFYPFYLAYLFISLTEALILTVFALMLSVVTRNTAASVGISMGIYFAGNLLNTILNNFFKYEWVDFLPFNNMELTSKIFPSNTLSQSLFGSGSVTSASSLHFTLLYLAALLICMGVTAYDSFCRKDIR